MLLMIVFGANMHEKATKKFVHGITIKLHHDRYHFAGLADGPNGETDIAGHKWLRIDKYRYLGRHNNTGPFGASNFWSSDAADGALLYAVEARTDKWTEKKRYRIT